MQKKAAKKSLQKKSAKKNPKKTAKALVCDRERLGVVIAKLLPDQRATVESIVQAYCDRKALSSKAIPSYIEVPLKDIANLLGVSQRYITTMVDEGMPRNADGSYPLAECINWRLNGSNKQSLKDEKTAVEIDLLKRKLADIEAKTVPVELHEAILTSREVAHKNFWTHVVLQNLQHLEMKSKEDLKPVLTELLIEAHKVYRDGGQTVTDE